MSGPKNSCSEAFARNVHALYTLQQELVYKTVYFNIYTTSIPETVVQHNIRRFSYLHQIPRKNNLIYRATLPFIKQDQPYTTVSAENHHLCCPYTMVTCTKPLCILFYEVSVDQIVTCKSRWHILDKAYVQRSSGASRRPLMNKKKILYMSLALTYSKENLKFGAHFLIPTLTRSGAWQRSHTRRSKSRD